MEILRIFIPLVKPAIFSDMMENLGDIASGLVGGK
jgi:hypothetical protein